MQVPPLSCCDVTVILEKIGTYMTKSMSDMADVDFLQCTLICTDGCRHSEDLP